MRADDAHVRKMRRILIADDRPLVRDTLRRFIEHADQRWQICGEASDGQEALEKAGDLRPDLIILDVIMPVLDGISAARKIRALLPDIPILIYTFLSFSGLETMAKEAGAQALISKGDLRELVSEIRRFLPSEPTITLATVSEVTELASLPLPLLESDGDPESKTERTQISASEDTSISDDPTPEA